MFKFLNIFRRKKSPLPPSAQLIKWDKEDVKTLQALANQKVDDQLRKNLNALPRKLPAYTSLDESFNMDGSRIKNPYEPPVYGPWVNYPASARIDRSFTKKSSSSREDDSSSREPYDSKRDDDRSWSSPSDNINYQD